MTIDPVPWVLKVGGRELDPAGGLPRVAELVSRAVRSGIPTVLVHGGGPEITERAEALGLPTERVEGQRVTDAAMLEVVVEVLGGRINLRLVRAIQEAGIPAIGLTGASGNLLPVVPLGDPPGALGFVGIPTEVRPRILRTLMGHGLTPIIAPLGLGPDGQLYNVNADLAAGALAAGLSADLSMITDVSAILGRDGRRIARIKGSEVPALRRNGTVTGGMIPKLEASASAIAGGARSAWIGDLDGIEPPGTPNDTGTVVTGRRIVPVPILPADTPGGKRA